MRRTMIALLSLVLVGFLVWLTQHPVEEGAGDRSDVPRRGAEAPESGVRLEPLLGALPARDPSSPQGARIEGRVVRGGAGVRATVSIHDGGPVARSGYGGDRLHALGHPLQVVESSADGSFHFEGCVAKRYLVQALDARGRRGLGDVVVSESLTRPFVVLRLRGGELELRGRAARGDGAPWTGRVGHEFEGDPMGAVGARGLVDTNDDGRFTLRGLPAGRVRLVAFVAGSFHLRGAEVQLPHDDEVVFVVDTTSNVIEGRVVDSVDETPIPGAVVRCRSWAEQGGLVARAASSADGSFRVSRLAGVGHLEVEAPGYAPIWHRVPEAEATTRVLLQAFGRIHGRVLDATTQVAIAGAVVRLRENGPARRAVTDADGRFVFEDARPGDCVVDVYGAGWYSVDAKTWGFESSNLKVPPGGVAEIDLHAFASASAEGRVLDHEGRPVAGALVWSRLEEGYTVMRSGGHVPLSPSVSDAEGRFVLETVLAKRDQVLLAEAPGVHTGRSESFRPQEGARVPVDVHLPPPRWLLATVRTIEGTAPVAGAEVSLQVPVVDSPGTTTWLGEATDAEGRALVGPLPEGELVARASADDYVETSQTLPASATGTVERSFEMEGAFRISGRVVLENDEPAAGLWLTAGQGEVLQDADTAKDGTFAFEGLGRGTWTLRVYVDGENLGAEAEVEAGSEGLRYVVSAKIRRALIVRVLDPEGEPVPLFQVSMGHEYSSSTTDAMHGRIDVEAGQIAEWIEICKPRTATGDPLPYAPVLLGPLRGDEGELEVRLEMGRSVSGVVRDPDGKGVAGLKVSLRPRDAAPGVPSIMSGSRASARTDADGRFEVVGLGPGRYRVYVSVPSVYAPVPRMTVDAGTTGLEIALAPGVEVKPRVVDARGEPVAGARIQVSRPSGGGLGWEKTDANGEVLLDGLEGEGRYQLEVTPPRDRPDVARYETHAWQPSNDPIVLAPALSVSGTVVDAEGQPVAGVQVFARTSNMPIGDAVDSAADGTFRIGHLSASPVALLATKWQTPPLHSAVVRVPAGTKDVLLAFGTERELLVRLLGAPPAWSGRSVPLAHGVMPEATGFAFGQPDGTALFRVDPEATYALYVFFEEAGLVAWREPIAGDAETVTVEATPALTIRGRIRTPADAGGAWVSLAERGVSVRTRAEPDGTFVLHGLPPGTWTVTASLRTASGLLRGEASAEAGGTVELDLR